MYINYQRPVSLAFFKQQPIQASKTTPSDAIFHGTTSVHFSGKNAFHTAAQSDSPETAIQKVLDKSPSHLESKLNASYAEPGFKEDTMRPIHYLLDNPKVTPKSVQLMIDNGVNINPSMNANNGYKSRHMPYDLFMISRNIDFNVFRDRPEIRSFQEQLQQAEVKPDQVKVNPDLVYLQMPHINNYLKVQELLEAHGASIGDPYFPDRRGDVTARNSVVRIMRSIRPYCYYDIWNSKNPPEALFKLLSKQRKSANDGGVPGNLQDDPNIVNGLFQVLLRNGRPLQENINRLRMLIVHTLAYDYVAGFPPSYYLKTSNNYDSIYTGKNLEIFKLNYSEMDRHKHTQRKVRAEAERKETTEMLVQLTEQIMQNLVIPGQADDVVMGGV